MTFDVSLRRWIPLSSALAVVVASLGGSSLAGASERDEWRARRIERNGRMAMHEGHRSERAGRPDGNRTMPRGMAREPQAHEIPFQAPPQRLPPPPPPAPAVDTGGRPGRLTPDERRALRQQINDAGRDVYRPNRP